MSTQGAFTLDATLRDDRPRAAKLARLAECQRAAERIAPQAEWRPLSDLGEITPQWRTLAANALETNVFYDPAFALAAMEKFGHGVGAVLIWSDDTKQRLTGLFPARIERRRYGVPLPLLIGWTHPYAPLGVPLVDAKEAEAAIIAWLDFIAQSDAMPHAVLLPYLRQDGAFAVLMRAALGTRQGQAIAYDAHERALLAPATDRNDYLQRAVSPKKRRELRRQGKRLSDQGALSFLHADDPLAVATALDDFLRLESLGWKGRAGTAAAADPAARAFMLGAVQALTESGQASVARLVVGEKTIAAGIVLRSGAGAWFWKIAYDEAYASTSPGVQLTLRLTEHLLADASLAQADSCATADHPMIDHVWRERLSLADVLIAPAPSAAFGAISRLESMRRTTIATLRVIKRRLRG